MKSETKIGKTVLILISAIGGYSGNALVPAIAQDWKPGDPVSFGAAHKSPFDASSAAGSPGSSRFLPAQNNASPAQATLGQSAPVNMGGAATQNPALNGIPDNFLNSRSIEWKPGDPVSFGAHRPYSPPDNRSLGGSPAGMVPAPMAPATPVTSASPVPTNAPSPAAMAGGSGALQDLAPSPVAGTFGGPERQSAPISFPGAPPADSMANYSQAAQPKAKVKTRAKGNSHAKPATASQAAPVAASTNNGQQALQAQNSSSNQSGNGQGSGNIFTHAMHWMSGLFGSNK